MLGTEKNISRVKRVYQKRGVNILFTGASGTGKSFLAKNIHECSIGHSYPFVHINAAAIPADLLESEIFGYKKGAFTGADKSVGGKLEAANYGTLFIDEIGELDFSLQSKLLTFLDTKTYYSLGSSEKKKFCGSLMFATNKDLKSLVDQGKFRNDLFYRLKVFDLKLLNLKERREDIESLMNFYLKKFKAEYQVDELKLSEQLKAWIKQYDWPGNIRELKNVIEYIVAMCEKPVAQLCDLPSWLETKSAYRASTLQYGESLLSTGVNLSYREAIKAFEKKFLAQELEKRSGRVNRTAFELGMSKTTLIAKTRKYGIKSAAS